MSNNKVWIITGCSTGFGRELAKATIEAGYNVVVTARKLNAIADLVSGNRDNVLAMELDVTKPDQIEKTVKGAIAKFGRIDVLVNNAGVGYFSSIEEADEEETRRMFEINFWGLMHMTNAVLPYMRSQLSGHIINISSIGGLASFPGVGYYNGTKYAVEGISESLAKEVASFHIHVTLIEPSNFRTDWSGRSAAKTHSAIKEYEELIAPFVNGESHGKEAGDPKKAAEAIVNIAELDEPPLRLLLGAEAYHTVVNKYSESLEHFEKWKDVAVNADFQ
ncbi:oxidoreductase [Paenibacillus radicis (ex Gao et al. 2016)]|uniref:Short-chain dehydrogenase/reductase n=1 Tax=Paenibacillus radicis (ex Gao et al. 2016) TaxID=1737354 RepID=A0A917GPW1_9BACL|nr:oxidoreductase [Paenibacillus radicis (ex Gao et al. 2016)]GGG53071.1 short-chain dehydrogenase/reductase [Paenibacillus radicis (ex Gao et al. 2016)]